MSATLTTTEPPAFDAAAFRAEVAELRERHTAELLDALTRHAGRRCEVCRLAPEVEPLELCGRTIPQFTVCRHVLRAIEIPLATADAAVRQFGVEPWD